MRQWKLQAYSTYKAILMPIILERPWLWLCLIMLPPLWTGAENAIAYAIKLFIDDSNLMAKHLSNFFFAICSFVILAELWMRLSAWITASTIPHIKAEIRRHLLAHINHYPLRFFDHNLAGSIAQKIDSCAEAVEQVFINLYYGFYAVSAGFVLTVIMVAQTHLVLATAFITWYLAMIFLTVYNVREHHRLAARCAACKTEYNGELLDLLRNIRQVYLYRTTYQEQERLNGYNSKLRIATRALEYHILRTDIYRGIISALLIITLLAISLWGWKAEIVSAGEFAFILTMAITVRRNIWSASLHIVSLYKDVGTISEAMTLLHEIPPSRSKARESLDKPLQGNIIFENVSFAYDLEQPSILTHFSLKIYPGEKIGLQGPSGAGKTTIFQLLNRILEPQEGQITIDGINLDMIATRILRRDIHYVPQEPFLFHRSVRENIAYGCSEFSDKTLIDAAKAALCEDFIMQLLQKFDTTVGEQGSLLSFGQRQRILLARLFMRPASILLLDESTSGLDVETANQVLSNLIRYRPDSTIIIASHRPETLALTERRITVGNIGS